jgi:hypothetical protein
MKERLTTLALALFALALFYVLFLPKPTSGAGAAPLPLSTEIGPDGYQAAWRWLEAGRIPVMALRDNYGRLDQAGTSLQPTGNLLLTTMPHKVGVRALEAGELDAWVSRGNTLVVMAALDDTPLWAFGNSRLVDAVGRLTRLKFDAIDEQQAEKAPGSSSAGERARNAAEKAPHRPLATLVTDLLDVRRSVIEPRGAHPLMDGVGAVRVASELPASRWRATPMDRSGVMQIGEIAGSGDAAIWLRRQGRGQVITFAVASIFSNRQIGEGDNARLLSNLIAWSLRDQGSVIFDDAHQGVVNYYDAKAFFSDPRLHRTLGWIVFLWFVFVLGVQPLRTRIRDWNPVDVTGFIAMSGEFFASTLGPAAAGARLFENFFNSIRRRLGLGQDGDPVWEWLSAQARVPPGELTELRRLHRRVRDGRRVDLVRLQYLLSQLQGHLV